MRVPWLMHTLLFYSRYQIAAKGSRRSRSRHWRSLHGPSLLRAAIANPEVEVNTVSDPVMNLRLLRAATANPEVEVKTVSDPYMDPRLFRAAIASPEVEDKTVSAPFVDLRPFRAAIATRRSRSRQ